MEYAKKVRIRYSVKAGKTFTLEDRIYAAVSISNHPSVKRVKYRDRIYKDNVFEVLLSDGVRPTDELSNELVAKMPSSMREVIGLIDFLQ